MTCLIALRGCLADHPAARAGRRRQPRAEQDHLQRRHHQRVGR